MSASLISLPPNPVWRSYRGGRLLREFRGQSATPDDHFPEDWLASSVLARNGEHSQGPREGISRIQYNGAELELPALRALSPEFFPAGSPEAPGSLGMLVKLLDSAERLHIQVHPDDEFVRSRLNGTKGKTECWYILSTRGDASVFLGFQRPPTRDAWREMIASQDIDSMLACFDAIPVSAGDCLVVPAGVPHAIGAGVFMVELQQPSDWVVRCEFSVGGHTLPESARFMGLSLDECLALFDYSPRATAQFKQSPASLRTSADFTEERVIDPEYARFFRMRRFRGTGAASIELPEPGILIVTQGAGCLNLAGETAPLARGVTVLLPAHPTCAKWLPTQGEWEFLIAQPPTTTNP